MNTNTIFIPFDEKLDYKSIINSFYIKKILEYTFGYFPKMVTSVESTFDRDKLEKFIQDEYNVSKPYIVNSRSMPSVIIGSYGMCLKLVEFETETLLDDHIVTINSDDKVLGVFATEDDFEKIIVKI